MPAMSDGDTTACDALNLRSELLVDDSKLGGRDVGPRGGDAKPLRLPAASTFTEVPGAVELLRSSALGCLRAQMQHAVKLLHRERERAHRSARLLRTASYVSIGMRAEFFQQCGGYGGGRSGSA